MKTSAAPTKKPMETERDYQTRLARIETDRRAKAYPKLVENLKRLENVARLQGADVDPGSAVSDAVELLRELGEDSFEDRKIEDRAARLEREIVAQKLWIESCGGDLAGYVAHYGIPGQPGCYGNGGAAIYEADVAYLRELEGRRV